MTTLPPAVPATAPKGEGETRANFAAKNVRVGREHVAGFRALLTPEAATLYPAKSAAKRANRNLARQPRANWVRDNGRHPNLTQSRESLVLT